MSARGLYTPEILAAAMGLADYPWEESLPFQGAARSRSCGSAIELGVSLDAAGNIDRIALRPHACAVGQAAASIFARSANGRNSADIAAARNALAHWLADEGAEPDWPGIALLAPARAYPARHAAILLAWDAALAALSAAVSA
ncbi:MAG: iron-sulfur cluster assembly scaffold protein [Novosphingobium sp.]